MKTFNILVLSLVFSFQAIAQSYRYINVKKTGFHDKPNKRSEAFFILHAPCKITVSNLVGMENSSWTYAYFTNEKNEEYEGYVLKKNLVNSLEDVTFNCDKNLSIHYSKPGGRPIAINSRTQRKVVTKSTTQSIANPIQTESSTLQVISDGKGDKKRIGILRRLTNKLMSCDKYTEKGSVYYIFNFKNEKYTKISSYESFIIDSEQDFEQLYKILMKGFKDMPKLDIVLKLGKGTLSLDYSRPLGVKKVTFYYTEYGVSSWSSILSPWQIRKLFGKKKRRK